jgi:VWFA-related protein
MAAFAFALSLLAQAAGQQPAPRRAEQQEDEDVVRITSNLIQVDAVVLDSHGRQVTDLNADDFELSEDGRAQAITNFSYVANASDSKTGAGAQPGSDGKSRASSSASSKNPSLPAPPPARVRPGGARRVIAFVVDDLGLSFEATAYVRRFLKKFVSEQMQPGDLVAVVRTSAGVGALQQFTGDPRLVERAVERVRFTPGFRAPTGAFAVPADKTRPDAKEGGGNDDAKSRDENDTTKEGGKDNAKKGEGGADRDALFTVGTLGALNYVLRGAAEMPGRKSVVLITEDTRIFKLTNRDASVRDYLQRMADLANRASATVYDLDAGDLKPDKLGSNLGIVTSIPSAPAQGGAGAQGNSGSSASALGASNQSFTNMSLAEAMLNDKALNGKNALYETKTALRFLAKQTGGAQVFGLERVLEDQKGYYLIGYRPDEKTFDAQAAGQRFHNINVRVKRPGLRVRHRLGFYSVPDAEAATGAPATREGRLLRALTSPLASGSIGLTLTPLFGNDSQTGSFVRALIHVDARGLRFTEEADGSRKAVIQVLAVTLGETGKPLDEVGEVETIRAASASDLERLLRSGLRYTVKVPVKKPGAYQLRVAMLDEATEQVGSANELIEVPDFGEARLALSGIVLSGRLPAVAPQNAVTQQPSGAASAADLELEADPAVRRLRSGMELHYDFIIYNAQADAATGRPRLQTQVRLFREGQLAYEGKLATFDTAQQEDLKRLRAGGSIKLSPAAAPGAYVLQLLVTDPLAKETRRTATQWIDFEITR